MQFNTILNILMMLHLKLYNILFLPLLNISFHFRRINEFIVLQQIQRKLLL